MSTVWRTLLLGATLGVATTMAIPGTSPSAISAGSAAFRATGCAGPDPHARYRCHALVEVRPATRSVRAFTGPSGFTPAELESAYALTAAATGSGTGQRVYVIVAYNDAGVESDLGIYRSQFGLPACTKSNGCLQVLNQLGETSPLPSAPPQDDDWATETSLQVDMVSAICPNCGITVIEADDDVGDGLDVALKEATTLGGSVVTVPWAGGDTGSDAAEDSQYLVSTGVVYAVASGDEGAATGAGWPALSPDVVSVGGTSLKTASSSRGWTETAWSGTGSGCSTHETKPSWQGVVSSADCAGRAENDVAAVADPNTGVAVYAEGGWEEIGGTSVAAPVIAATFALAGTPGSSEVPAALLYEHQSDLNDVTSGTNGSCSAPIICQAEAGWDGPTGNGTPNGTAAFAAPRNDASALSAGSKQMIRYGSTVKLATKLTDPSTHSAIGGATVDLLKRSAGARTFTSAATANTSSSGSASVKVSPSVNATFKWRYAGSTGHQAVTSKGEVVDVGFATTLSVKASKNGKALALYGTAKPGKRGLVVSLERKAGKAWQKVGHAKLGEQRLPNGNKTLGYVFDYPVGRKGSATFRAVAHAATSNVAGTSKAVTVVLT